MAKRGRWNAALAAARFDGGLRLCYKMLSDMRRTSEREHNIRGPRVNRGIHVREVRLIDKDGKNHGIMPTEEALRIAREQGMDLVEVAPGEQPPVCRVMDYGKLRYDQKRKRAQASRGGGGELKELGLSMKISDHDLGVKIRQAEKFLEKGHKVKFNLMLRGREKSFQDSLAPQLLDRIIEMMSDRGAVDQRSSRMIGNRLFVIIAPSRSGGRKEGKTKRDQDKGENASIHSEAGPPHQGGQAAAQAGARTPSAGEEELPPETSS